MEPREHPTLAWAVLQGHLRGGLDGRPYQFKCQLGGTTVEGLSHVCCPRCAKRPNHESSAGDPSDTRRLRPGEEEVSEWSPSSEEIEDATRAIVKVHNQAGHIRAVGPTVDSATYVAHEASSGGQGDQLSNYPPTPLEDRTPRRTHIFLSLVSVPQLTALFTRTCVREAQGSRLRSNS